MVRHGVVGQAEKHTVELLSLAARGEAAKGTKEGLRGRPQVQESVETRLGGGASEVCKVSTPTFYLKS
jgi:hypothetical protein